MLTERRCYEVLGLEPGTPLSEIKLQYRKLSLKLHPDKNKSPDANECMREIIEAYEFLSEPEIKDNYSDGKDENVKEEYHTKNTNQGVGWCDIFMLIYFALDFMVEAIWGDDNSCPENRINIITEYILSNAASSDSSE